MKNYIRKPITHESWDPSKGDYYSKNIHEEDKSYERKQTNKKNFVLLLIMIHLLLFLSLFFI